MLLQELEGLCGARQMPLVLCGDFNSTPDSAAVELLVHETVDPKHPDLEYDKIGILPPVSQLTHTLGLVSVVAQVTGQEPPITNFTGNYKGCLDYIFLNDSLAAVACFEMPTEEDLLAVDGTYMPNSVYPSDHVSICVDVRLAARGGAAGGVPGVY